MNWLFICSRNQWRSPTAERLFSCIAGINTRSAGTRQSARRMVQPYDLRWADYIFVMEQHHQKQLIASYPQLLRHKPVTVFDIPDDHGYMDADLIDCLCQSMQPYLPNISLKSPM